MVILVGACFIFAAGHTAIRRFAHGGSNIRVRAFMLAVRRSFTRTTAGPARCISPKNWTIRRDRSALDVLWAAESSPYLSADQRCVRLRRADERIGGIAACRRPSRRRCSVSVTTPVRIVVGIDASESMPVY